MKESKLKKMLSLKSIQDSIVFFIFGLYLLGYALINHYTGIVVGWEMSPYLFPVLIAIFLVALSFSLFADGLHQLRDGKVDDGEDDPNLKGALVVTVAAIAYYLLMPVITFVPATIAFLGITFFYLGERRWWLIALLSTVTAGVIYAIFGMMLHVMLP